MHFEPASSAEYEVCVSFTDEESTHSTNKRVQINSDDSETETSTSQDLLTETITLMENPHCPNKCIS